MGASAAGILIRASDHLLSDELRRKALEIALGEHNTLAKGTSRTWGDVGKYQEAIGLSSGGHDYCVCFLYWCYEQAAAALDAEQGCCVYGNPLPRQGLVSKLYTDALRQGRLVDRPKAGDIFIRGKAEFKHVGFVSEDPEPGSHWMFTMEGNTKGEDPNNKHVLRWGAFKSSKKKDLSTCYFARY